MKLAIPLTVFLSLLLIIMALYIFPNVEGVLIYSGSQIDAATGYTPNRAAVNAAQTGLWATMVVFVTVAAFVMVFAETRGAHD